MTTNVYTTQFYTKRETNSLISQTASSIDLSVNQKLSNYSTTEEMNSAISMTADSITSEVSQTYATKTTTNTLCSRIQQTATGISLSVNNGSTSSGITITTTKENGEQSTATGTIQMNGLVKFTDLSTNTQSTIINGANIRTGTISAARLDLSDYLTIGAADQTYLDKSDASTTYASKSSLSTAGQTVINGSNITTGIIKSSNYASGTAGTSINLTNGVIDSKNFKIDSSGNVTISGNITASSGYIGNSSSGFTIGSTKLYNGKSTLTANTAGVYIGTDGISLGTGSTFKVTNAGEVTATNITATGGRIGGWTITSTQLQAHNGQNYAYINNTSGTNKDFLFVENRNNSTNPSDWTYPVIIRANGYAKFDNLDMSGNISSSNISGSAISGGTISGATITGSVISARDTLSAQDINASFSIYAGTEISTNSAYVCQGKWGATTNATVTIGGNIYKFVGGILVSA